MRDHAGGKAWREPVIHADLGQTISGLGFVVIHLLYPLSGVTRAVDLITYLFLSHSLPLALAHSLTHAHTRANARNKGDVHWVGLT